MVERSQHVKSLTLVQDSNVAVITQHHFQFFSTAQKVERILQLEKGLYSRYSDEANAVIEDVMVEGSLQLSCMRWVTINMKMLPISDLVDSDSNVYALVSSCVEATGISHRSHLDFIVSTTSSSSSCFAAGSKEGGSGVSGAMRVIA